VVSLFLYAIFLLIQTMRHRGYFMESEQAGVTAGPAHHSLRVQSTAFHAPMLLLYLIVVILLAEKFAIPLDNSIEQFGMPQEFGGAMIAALGAYARGNWRYPRHFAQSVAAFDKHPTRLRACNHRTHNSRRTDN
jgi:Ca2+/H+ antiporter